MNIPDKTNLFEKLAPYLLILFIILLWLFYPIALSWINTKLPEIKLAQTGETFGTFGDTYGALNTLFSGLAFSILILSLFLQRKELQAQRKELSAQRGEIAKSNEIAEHQRLITQQQKELNEQQIQDAKVQNFYTLLFKFLDEKRRKIDELELTNSSEVKGDYVFDRFIKGALQRLKASYIDKKLVETTPIDELKLIIENLIISGHKITKNILNESEYFEYICFILRFIEENKNLGITDNAIKIFVSYQSINEMISMFIFSLEDEELKNFIIKYALLRKLNTYVADEYILALVNRTLDENSYTR